MWPGRLPLAPGHFCPGLAKSLQLQSEVRVHFLNPQTPPSRPSSPHRSHETTGGPRHKEWLCYCHLGLGRKAWGDLSPPTGPAQDSGDLV